MTNLTQYETKALLSVTTNYDCAEKEIEDNAGATDIQDVSDACSITTSQARGVVSSLIQKGFMVKDEPIEMLSGEVRENFGLTEAGIYKHFELKK